MKRISPRTGMALGALLFGALGLSLLDYRITSHATVVSPVGDPALPAKVTTTAALELLMDQVGPLEAFTVHSADWAVERGGLVNLSDAKAKAAHLSNSDEPIHIDFHVVKHPTRGTFLIDTGVECALRDAPEKSMVQGLLAHFMHLEKLHARMPLGDYLEAEHVKLSGVFLTHLHLDHITGIGDVPRDTPVYLGKGETRTGQFTNLFLSPTINQAFAGRPPLRELPFAEGGDGLFDGVLDLFGDGSLFALLVPGHTAGSMAFVARTKDGPVLYVGDTSHTQWGWENEVEPGWFTVDHPANKKSLLALRALAARHPRTVVHLGHQDVTAVVADATRSPVEAPK